MCQETSPESGEGPIPSSPALFIPADLPEESQPPVIHDMVTTSPSDHELLGTTPFVTNMDLGASQDIPASEFLQPEPEEPCAAQPLPEDPVAAEREDDQPGEVDSTPAIAAEQSPVLSAEPAAGIPTETLTAAEASAHDEAAVGVAAEASNQYQEEPVTESLIDGGSLNVKAHDEVEEEEAAAEHDEVDHDDKVIQGEVAEEEGVVEEEEEEEEGMRSVCEKLDDCEAWSACRHTVHP